MLSSLLVQVEDLALGEVQRLEAATSGLSPPLLAQVVVAVPTVRPPIPVPSPEVGGDIDGHPEPHEEIAVPSPRQAESKQSGNALAGQWNSGLSTGSSLRTPVAEATSQFVAVDNDCSKPDRGPQQSGCAVSTEGPKPERHSANGKVSSETGIWAPITRSFSSKEKGHVKHGMTKREAQLAKAISRNEHVVRFSEESLLSNRCGDKRFLTLALDSAMGVVICLNCVSIGLSSDLHATWSGWVIVDAVFAGMFLAEVFIMMRLQGWREYLLGSDCHWHIFEVLLVILAVLEVALSLAHPAASQDSSANNFSLFRVIRLVRITRLLRVCRLAIFCDLVAMVKGTLGGIKTLLWSVVLISLPLYAASLFFRETLGPFHSQGHGAEAFRNVPMSLFTVFRCIVGGECTDVDGRPIFVSVVDKYGWSYGFVYCAVQVFMTFGLFNVIVAIFIENVLSGAKTNDLLMRRQRIQNEVFWGTKMLEMSTLICETRRSMHGRTTSAEPMTPQMYLAEAQDIQISPELFDALHHTDAFSDILKDLDVCEEDRQHLFETLDADVSGTIDFEELLVGIEKLRGDARRSDIVSVNLKISTLVSHLQCEFESVKASLGHQDKSMQALIARLS